VRLASLVVAEDLFGDQLGVHERAAVVRRLPARLCIFGCLVEVGVDIRIGVELLVVVVRLAVTAVDVFDDTVGLVERMRDVVERSEVRLLSGGIVVLVIRGEIGCIHSGDDTPVRDPSIGLEKLSRRGALSRESSRAVVCYLYRVVKTAVDGGTVTRPIEEFEDEAGVVTKYRRHLNGRGRVASGAKVHPSAFVESSAYVEADARVGQNAWIGAGSWVDRGAALSDGVFVGANVHIGRGVLVGRGARLGSNSRIEPDVRIGDEVRVERDSRVNEDLGLRERARRSSADGFAKAA
jgi:acetyltransferase-like isoleucine patch superfamily enzyme